MGEVITVSVDTLEQMIRRAVREEVKQAIAEEFQVFYLKPDTPLYDDMKEILSLKRQGAIRVLSREEAFGAHG